MEKSGFLFLMIIWLFAGTGCASETMNKTIYDAANQRNCIKETGGNPNCNPDQPGYEEYKRQRDELSK